jgi:hypothetical protein
VDSSSLSERARQVPQISDLSAAAVTETRIRRFHSAALVVVGCLGEDFGRESGCSQISVSRSRLHHPISHH